MGCLDENTVVELLGRRLPAPRLAELHAHVDACEACRAVVAAAAGEVAGAPDDDGLILETYVSPPPSSGRAPLTMSRTLPAPDGEPLLAPGTQVDHYSIVRLIGGGGMGQVYLALDTLLERKVALKMVHPELSGQGNAVEWFLAEARTTARLDHPNIVRIHAVGKHGSRPYVALELLTGQTLRERLKNGVLDPEETLHLARAVARALEVAHGHGVCHRDLKPGNVMLCVDRRICVLDFGLAKVVDRDALEVTWVGGRPTPMSPDDIAKSSSLVGGTPAYMAPERWRGEPTTGAADIWALGIMLYESLTGTRPFTPPTDAAAGRTAKVLDVARAIVEGGPVPSLVGHPGVPRRLADIVAACLEKDPARRPTATRLLAQLDDLAIELAVTSIPPGGLPAALPPVRSADATRRRRLLGIAAVAFVAVLLLLLVPLSRRSSATAGIDELPSEGPAAVSDSPAGFVPALPPPLEPATAPASPSSSAATAQSARPSPARTADPWDPASYR